MQTIALVSGFIYVLQERKLKEKHTPKIFYWVLVQTLVHPPFGTSYFSISFQSVSFLYFCVHTQTCVIVVSVLGISGLSEVTE